MRQTKNRVGETNIAICGLKMTIIRYGNASDIDVQFENGTVVKHKTYQNFQKGTIGNPNFVNNRTGESNVATCGMKMTIVRYGNASDIDVQFEDDTVVKHKTYQNFQKGRIHPNYADNRLGETKVANCGMKITIVRYGNPSDIDVQFEDGTVAKNKSYSAFKRGQICPPVNYDGRIGETNIANCGMKMTVIGYKNYRDVTVEFEDHTILEHKLYNSFQKGVIGHPELSVSRLCIYKNIAAKYAWRENDKVYYICKCTKCGQENIWTPQQMIEHAKKCRNTVH